MTTNKCSETCSRSIDATPDTVLDIVGDIGLMPTWAPGFAPAVRRDGDVWVIVDDRPPSEQRRIRALVSREAGTVDIVAASDPTIGVFLRTLRNGTGTELLFTIFFPEDVDEAAVAEQLAVIDGELATIGKLAVNDSGRF